MQATPITPLESLRACTSKDDLIDFLEIDSVEFDQCIALKGDYRYIEFKIPKKNGESRTIHAPSEKLKRIQKKIRQALEERYRPSKAVKGFIVDESFITNASFHVQKKWVFNIDLENFYQTIHAGRINGIIKSPKYFKIDPEISKYITRICTFNGSLPIGAPTSPILSNIIAGKLDSQLVDLASSLRITFTRYADDISFSSHDAMPPKEICKISKSENGNWTAEIGNRLSKIIEENSFRVNHSKTRFQDCRSRQVVTGIVVNKKINNFRSDVKNSELNCM